MFDSFTDVLGGVVAAIAVSYIAFAVNRKRKHLSKLFNVITDADAAMYFELEDMVDTGVLMPHHRTAVA